MTEDPIIFSPLENIKNTLHVLMKNCIHWLPAVKGGELVGIVAVMDLRMALAQEARDQNLNVSSATINNRVNVSEDMNLVEVR